MKILSRVKILAGSGEIGRAVAVSAVAIALAVYAIALQERSTTVVLLSAVILLVAGGAMLQVSRAVRQFHQAQQQAQRQAVRAERHYFKVLRRILHAIENREQYTRGRSIRVGKLAQRIALKLGMDRRMARLLNLAGQVADIGLLSVPERILSKPARIGTAEFRALQRHAEDSYRILEPLKMLEEILTAVRYHHERMNGTGYPFGLRGEQIPVTARILSVADAYDAMTHDRPHRPALPVIAALQELRRCCPAGYDSDCVSALEEMMNARKLEEVFAGN